MRIRESNFGAYVDLAPELPAGTRVMVAATGRYGLEPRLILLPHQLYLKTIAKLLEDDAGGRVAVAPLVTPWAEVDNEIVREALAVGAVA